MIIPIYSQDFCRIVLPLILKARNTIDVLTYDWRWYPNNPEHDIQKINVAMISLISRGVKVRVLLQDKSMVEFLKSLKVLARVHSDGRTLHAKLMIIDQKYLIIGSHNLTHRALDYNIETSLLIDDPDIVSHHQLLFNHLYGL